MVGDTSRIGIFRVVVTTRTLNHGGHGVTRGDGLGDELEAAPDLPRVIPRGLRDDALLLAGSKGTPVASEFSEQW